MEQHAITVILNSGSNPEEKNKLAEDIAAAFAEAGKKAHIITIQHGDDVPRVCEEWVAKSKASGGNIAAAGGDGTINTVAGICYKHGVTLGVIPMGTFNYFARELLIPTNIPDAVQIIATGNTRKVAVGLVQDKIFLNNASFGLYPRLIRQREEASSRFGRARIVAFFAASYSLFQEQKLLAVKFNSGTGEEWHKTSMVFVGNNTLQLENLGMDVAECTKQDKLAIIIMKESTRIEIARLLLRGIVRSLKDQSKLLEYCADSFEVTTQNKRIDMVIDGEIMRIETPLKFRVEKQALSVFVPQEKNA